MTLSQIANVVVTEKSAYLIRLRTGAAAKETKQYDVKPLFTGRKKGWTILDSMTASAVVAVHKALRDDLKPRFDTIPLTKAVDFCWRMVK